MTTLRISSRHVIQSHVSLQVMNPVSRLSLRSSWVYVLHPGCGLSLAPAASVWLLWPGSGTSGLGLAPVAWVTLGPELRTLDHRSLSICKKYWSNNTPSLKTTIFLIQSTFSQNHRCGLYYSTTSKSINFFPQFLLSTKKP